MKNNCYVENEIILISFCVKSFLIEKRENYNLWCLDSLQPILIKKYFNMYSFQLECFFN
jgi:hypothetical protein